MTEHESSGQDGTTAELYRGFGHGQSRAVELAVTPVILAGLGWLLDGWLGLVPVFTIALFLVGMVGLTARLWYGYDAQMRAYEADSRWRTP